ncbi:hypothetical protein ABPG77_004807 [Micractinium sp. CCAP 211/92]
MIPARPATLSLLLYGLVTAATAQLAKNRFQEELLAQKRAVSNWADFAAANGIKGWEDQYKRPGATDVCQWTGIGCSLYDQSVTSLNLACGGYTGAPFCKVQARGTLAPELANMTSLLELSLSGQQFTGTLPAAWGGNASFQSLQTLSLYSNQLRGTVPESWGGQGAWPELQRLDMKNNLLRGTLPDSWARFPKLELLDVSNNTYFQGTLPVAWSRPGALPALRAISFQVNRLNGSLPAEWATEGAFAQLVDFNLAFNSLSGALPDSWGNATAFPSLVQLLMSVNSLTGTLPGAWASNGGFQQLSVLQLDSNLLEGSIPSAWSLNTSFPSLTALDLDNNPALCGSVAANLFPAVCDPASATECTGTLLKPCVASFPAASSADVQALLAQKAAISNWREFAASKNLTGWDAATPVCEWGGVTCSEEGAVITIDLSCQLVDADFAGDVPLAYEEAPLVIPVSEPCTARAQGTLALELSTLGSLQNLLFYNNHLSSTLPTEWGASGAFPNLLTLDLSSNRLTGTLPDSWASGSGAFPILQVIHLERNRLNGTLPPGWAAPTSPFPLALQTIALASNALTGPLPAEWNSLTFLSLLDVGNNSLSGTLPASWGKNGSFPQLTELHLNNQNSLRGPLPSDWGSAGSFPLLWLLDVNNNQLTGTLPETWGARNASFPLAGVFEMNNNRLSGPLPAGWASNTSFSQLAALELRNNNLSGSFPPSWNTTAALPALQALMLAGNKDFCGPVPPLLRPAVCQDPETMPSNQCTKGEIVCQGQAPPPAAPAPSAPPPPPVEPPPASSSTPVGAIVGGVVGGLVVAAAAGVPAVCWRRRRAARQHGQASASKPGATRRRSAPFLSATSGSGKLLFDPEEEEGEPAVSKLVPAADPRGLSHLPAGAGPSPGSLLPNSYITTGGLLRRANVPGSFPSDPSVPTPQTSSLHSLESDPVLTLISTRLATRRQQPSTATGLATLAASGRSSSAVSRTTSALPEEVRQWAVDWEAIQLERLIGKGSYGRVYLATWNATPVAVKVLISADGSEAQSNNELELPAEITKQLQEEAVVMSRMRHPNVVSFMGLCMLPPCILIEYCSRGSLYDVLRQAARDPEAAVQLTWQRRLSMLFDAARGLLYLHKREPPIIHHDVKSPNLLVDRNWSVKVCDFNLSEILRNQAPGAPAAGATNPIWLAPEVLDGQRATAASDVYAFGLVMYEVLTWQLPWRNLDPYQIRRSVLDGRRPQVPAFEALPGAERGAFVHLAAYIQLMQDCWVQEPGRRPSFDDAVARLQLLMGVPAMRHSVERSVDS